MIPSFRGRSVGAGGRGTAKGGASLLPRGGAPRARPCCATASGLPKPATAAMHHPTSAVLMVPRRHAERPPRHDRRRNGCVEARTGLTALSAEMDTGSAQESASKQRLRAVLDCSAHGTRQCRRRRTRRGSPLPCGRPDAHISTRVRKAIAIRASPSPLCGGGWPPKGVGRGERRCRTRLWPSRRPRLSRKPGSPLAGLRPGPPPADAGATLPRRATGFTHL